MCDIIVLNVKHSFGDAYCRSMELYGIMHKYDIFIQVIYLKCDYFC